jgi:RNA polymerase sigma factor (sigma-70 family)
VDDVRVTREPAGDPEAARKRAVVELIAREEAALKRTARRFSICAEDAEDAYQRALEIVLTKAPTDDPRELIRWTQVVTKHEALAIRRHRERMLSSPPPRGEPDEELDWIALIPAGGDGPDVRAEKRERIARSREALRALKPAELRALTLLAEGYSYAEIGEITGYSRTKVNRCLAEGRERFRSLVSGSEDGSRCREMLPMLSAYCDGEAVDEGVVREHLRACAGCRATLREYRGAPRAAAALAPLLPAAPATFLDRLQELFSAIHSRLPGATGPTGPAAPGGTAGGGVVAGAAGGAGAATMGGAGGVGMTTLAKALLVCAGTVGGAAACVAGGVIPAPPNPLPKQRTEAAEVERVAKTAFSASGAAAEPAAESAPTGDAGREPVRHRERREPAEPAPTPVEAGAVDYTAPSVSEAGSPVPETAPPVSEAPTPPTAPAAEPSSTGGSAAGEFGP